MTEIETTEELLDYPFVKDKVQMLPYDYVKSRRVLPIEERDGVLWVATSDPLAMEVLEEVRLKLGK